MKDLYSFGEFRLDRARRVLSRSGEPVALTPKGFDLLLTLLENRDRLVSKDELLDKVWPGTFVEEGVLKYNVSMLRRALGEQSWIETQPKRGYRFAGDVTERTELAVSVEAEVTGAPRMGRWLAGGLALAMAAGGWMLWGRPAAVRTMAVLPLQSLSGGDRETELGLTDSLIARLGAEGPWLVRPTGAVRGFTGKDRDPIAAGRELGVDAVMDGTLQRSENQLRLTLQLLQVKDGKQLWTRTLDKKITDLFAMEDQIAAEVAHALRVKLRTTGDRPASAQPEVYDSYLSGRHYFLESTAVATRRAIRYFEEAIAKDPEFAPAYGMLALSYWQLSQRGGGTAGEVRDKLTAAANRAVQLDPANPEGHTARSLALMWLDYDWDGARKEYERALELSPHQPLVHVAWGIHAMAHGRFDETARAYREELEIHPQALMSVVAMGYPLMYAGRYDEAIAWYRKALQVDPEFPIAWRDLGIAYHLKAMYPEYVEATLKNAALTGSKPEETARRLSIFRQEGIDGFRRDALATSFTRLERGQPVSPVAFAGTYCSMGEKQKSLDWLERAVDEHTFQVLFLGSFPGWAKLRDEPRYHALLKRMRLE